ncbi:MAG: NlpC/P60 family protein [Fibrobacterales bacterium]
MPKFLIAITIAFLFIGCAGNPQVRTVHVEKEFSRAGGKNINEKLVKWREIKKEKLKEVADSYLGVPYLWGGNTRKGIDCSAFIRAVFKEVYDLDMPRRATWQGEFGVFIFKYNIQPGDLVFFGPDPEDITHVGLYMGDGKFINATSSGGVKYSGLDEKYWAKQYQFAKRFVY